MEFGPYQIQIFISLALIMAASLVALICDYLKGDNQRLRELAVELKVRNEESDRLVGLLASKDAPRKASTPARKEIVASSPTHVTTPEPQRALSRAAVPAGPAEVKKPEVVATPKSVFVPPAEPAAPVTPPVDILQQMVDAVSARNVAEQAQTLIKIKKDLNSQVRQAQSTQPREGAVPKPAPETRALLDAVVAATAEPGTAPRSLPLGVQNAAVLQEWTDRGRRVSGLIVFVAITSPSPAETLAEFPAAARSAIETLLEPGEFAAPAGQNQFVLISPSARGPSAQRRLGRFTQRLWDVQLESLGQFELQFSWGALEVRDEPIQAAIESAAERMYETRHFRNPVTMTATPQSSPPLREAV